MKENWELMIFSIQNSIKIFRKAVVRQTLFKFGGAFFSSVLPYLTELYALCKQKHIYENKNIVTSFNIKND